ncbi:hypothetical protein M3Y99_00604000 [Aphelenchoides fujianensis]|nr:hypothetical protein M3Y99_00604000 [Aphelenchoides fujianensis]
MLNICRILPGQSPDPVGTARKQKAIRKIVSCLLFFLIFQGSLNVYLWAASDSNAFADYLISVLSLFTYATNPFLYYLAREESLWQKTLEFLAAVLVRPARSIASGIRERLVRSKSEQQPPAVTPQPAIEMREWESGDRTRETPRTSL